MKTRVLGLAALLVALTPAMSVARAGDAQPSNADTAFAQLKAMVGHWQASTPDGGKAVYDYEVVSDGSAVMERLMPANHSMEMVTMYHLDGGRLMMTHYCAAGNQPRMAAESYPPNSHKLVFNYVDATNMKSADDGHMGRVEIEFMDANHVNETWTFYKDQKVATTETFHMTRM
jgi:hypothetical protein